MYFCDVMIVVCKRLKYKFYSVRIFEKSFFLCVSIRGFCCFLEGRFKEPARRFRFRLGMNVSRDSLETFVDSRRLSTAFRANCG